MPRAFYPPNGGVTYQAVWGTSSSDVWLAGVYPWHWNGSTWTQSPTLMNNVRAMHGAATNDIWAASAGTFWRWNGSTWSQSGVLGSAITGLFALAADDVWAVSTNAGGPLVGHWNGSTWGTSTPDVTLYGVWGAAANDVWFVGAGGTVLHWNGIEWSEIETGAGVTLDAVFALGSDVWIGGAPSTLIHGTVAP